MNILAIDTSTNIATIALIENENIIAEFTLNSLKTHSETILPMVSNILKFSDKDIKDIDFLACSLGPGSFTGLRIGASFVKGLAHGIKKPIVTVSTLDYLAYNVFYEDKLIVPIMDARRNNVYTCVYLKENEKLIKKTDYMCEDIKNLIEILETYEKKAIFLGDGTNVYYDQIIKFGHTLAPINLRFQRASSLAILAKGLIKEKKYVDYNNFELMYIRKPQAEREYELKNKQ